MREKKIKREKEIEGGGARERKLEREKERKEKKV